MHIQRVVRQDVPDILVQLQGLQVPAHLSGHKPHNLSLGLVTRVEHGTHQLPGVDAALVM